MLKTGWGATLSSQPPAPAWNQHSSRNLVLIKLLPGLVASQEEEKYLHSSLTVSPQDHCPLWLSALRFEIFLYCEAYVLLWKRCSSYRPNIWKVFLFFLSVCLWRLCSLRFCFRLRWPPDLAYLRLLGRNASRNINASRTGCFGGVPPNKTWCRKVYMKWVLLQCSKATQPQPRRKLLNVQSTRCTS